MLSPNSRKALISDNLFCLDFEAGALEVGSYPIEVGIVNVSTTKSHAWLIRPTDDWITNGVWRDEGVKIHKISFEQLMEEGKPVELVATELADVCTGAVMLSDAPSYKFDGYWLTRLYDAAKMIPPFNLDDYHVFAWNLCVKAGRRPDIAINKSELEAQIRFPHIHRAVADARGNAETLRLIAGLDLRL